MITLVALAILPLAACGSQRSTLPPSPGTAGSVALRDLAHFPEVYADATVATVGTVARIGGRANPLFVLEGGGGGARIVLEPAARAASELRRRVRVSGLFTVSFQLGYEILISRITPVGSL
jgi:hypothetical protein